MLLKQLPPVLRRAYLAGANVFLQGKPGIGKTETVQAFAKMMAQQIEGFTLWPFYAPTMSPVDIQAAMPDNDSGTLRVFNNDSLPNAYTHPDAVGVVFLGEMPNADPATLKLLQKYVNGEDMNGVLRKPLGVRVIADGNRTEDKSGALQQGRAFLNRFEILEVGSTAEDNCQFALENAWHPTVQAFMRQFPQYIDNYDEVFAVGKDTGTYEEGRRGLWASMRGWNRVSALEYVAEGANEELTLSEIAGSVGSGVGSQYVTYKQMVERLISLEDIIKAPDTAVIPTKIDERYALAMLLSLRARSEHLGAVATFGRRLPADMQVVMIRAIVGRPEIDRKDRSFVDWLLSKELAPMLQGSA